MVETPENLPAGDLGFDGWYKRPLIIFGHVVLATVGAGLVASLMWKRLFALALAVNVLGARDLLGLFSTPFFPVQFAIGAALGYLFSRIFPEKLAIFVWTPAAAWFLLRWITLPRSDSLLSSSMEPKWNHFFGDGCKPPCPDQWMFVLPLMAALGYTLGVLLQRSGVFTFSRSDTTASTQASR
jgi:hypothetical protein